jgi:hypothetical protein
MSSYAGIPMREYGVYLMRKDVQLNIGIPEIGLGIGVLLLL